MRIQKGSTSRTLVSILMFAYCAMIPFEEVLAGSFGSVLKLIGIGVMGVVVLVSRRWALMKVWLWMVVWMAFCAISFFWASSYDWWYYFTKIYFNQFLFAVLVSNMSTELIDIENEKRGLITGAVAASLILMVLPTFSMYTDEGRRTLILFGANMDPNILATTFVIAFWCLLSMYKKDGFTKPQKILYFTIMVVLIGGVLLTGSRGALIGLTVSLVLLLFMFLRSREKRRAALLLLSGGFLAVVVMAALLPENLVTSRFSLDTILGMNEYNAGSHNRYTIWMNALTLFVESPVIGHGNGNFFSAIEAIYRECAAHNLLVLQLVEVGIIGTIFLTVFIVGMVKRTYRTGDMYMFCLMVAVLVIALTLDSLPYKYFWMMFILASHTIRMANPPTRDVFEKRS